MAKKDQLIQVPQKTLTRRTAAVTSSLPLSKPRGSRYFFLIGMAAVVGGCFVLNCAIVATRPVQEMSDTAAAIRAAREVQADSLAPELFREATELFSQAKNEYRAKNFMLAKQYADQARNYAEQAEFEVIKFGSSRTSSKLPDPLSEGAVGDPETAAIQAERSAGAPPKEENPRYSYPKPEGTYMEYYDEHEKDRAAQDAKKTQYQYFQGMGGATGTPSSSFSGGYRGGATKSNTGGTTPGTTGGTNTQGTTTPVQQ